MHVKIVTEFLYSHRKIDHTEQPFFIVVEYSDIFLSTRFVWLLFSETFPYARIDLVGPGKLHCTPFEPLIYVIFM